MTGTSNAITSGNDLQSSSTWLLSQLTQDELEIAARTSYDYFVDRDVAKETERDNHARFFAERFLKSTRDPQKALRRVRGTLAFRKEIGVDGLRQAFDIDVGENNTTVPLKDHLKNKSLYVQGYDKEGRSTYVFLPRHVESHDSEWTLKSHVYTLERALACTRAGDGTVNAVIDFKGFSLQNTPPISIGTQFMTTFREHYAGAIHQIYLVDTPMAFHVLWKLMKGFVGTKTRNKIHFIKSTCKNQGRRDGHPLAKLYDRDQLAPWMMEGGTFNRSFDLNEYLHKTDFDHSFDET